VHNPDLIYTTQTEVVNTKPKLRLQNVVGAEFCLKCGKTLKLRSLKLSKVVQCLYGVLAGTTKKYVKYGKNLTLRNVRSG
jgi:hypothetical protein